MIPFLQFLITCREFDNDTLLKYTINRRRVLKYRLEVTDIKNNLFILTIKNSIDLPWETLYCDKRALWMWTEIMFQIIWKFC